MTMIIRKIKDQEVVAIGHYNPSGQWETLWVVSTHVSGAEELAASVFNYLNGGTGVPVASLEYIGQQVINAIKRSEENGS